MRPTEHKQYSSIAYHNSYNEALAQVCPHITHHAIDILLILTGRNAPANYTTLQRTRNAEYIVRALRYLLRNQYITVSYHGRAHMYSHTLKGKELLQRVEDTLSALVAGK